MARARRRAASSVSMSGIGESPRAPRWWERTSRTAWARAESSPLSIANAANEGQRYPPRCGRSRPRHGLGRARTRRSAAASVRGIVPALEIGGRVPGGIEGAARRTEETNPDAARDSGKKTYDDG